MSETVVANGLSVNVRPIRPDDAERLVEFHARLSEQSVYRRYFFIHPSLSAAEVRHLTQVDHHDRLALIVEIEGSMVAVGRYDREVGTARAEVAFVVADAFQHHGIGSLLLERLSAAARVNGVITFEAQILCDNRPMLGVLFGSGFPVTSTSEHDTVWVEFPIQPTDASRAAEARRRPPVDRGGPTWRSRARGD